MSRFYGSIQGSRGPATRVGTQPSGMTGHIRGWHNGAKVHMDTTSSDHDRCTVALTAGSNGGRDGYKVVGESVYRADSETTRVTLWSPVDGSVLGEFFKSATGEWTRVG